MAHQQARPRPGFFAFTGALLMPLPAHLPSSRSVDWTKERIALLGTIEIKQLRANAERLNDPEIVGRCNEVLGERPRSGVARPGARPSARRSKKEKAAPATGKAA
jgi:hypothetical protein